MKNITDQIAEETGIEGREANYIFTAICNRIITKVPALQKVIDDVFKDTEQHNLEKDVGEMATILQEQQWKEKFKTWMIPPQNTQKINFTGNGELF